MTIETRPEEESVFPRSDDSSDHTQVLADFPQRGQCWRQSRFLDDTWDLHPAAILAENSRTCTHRVDFRSLPDPMDRLVAKVRVWAAVR
jgi:hypothetical protein